MLWTIMVTACLGFGPCKDFELDSGQPTKQACELMAQVALVAFSDVHPKWRIARYKCLPPGARIDI